MSGNVYSKGVRMHGIVGQGIRYVKLPLPKAHGAPYRKNGALYVGSQGVPRKERSASAPDVENNQPRTPQLRATVAQKTT